MSGRTVHRPDDHGLVRRRAAHSLPVALVPVHLRTAEVGLVELDGDLVRCKILRNSERRLRAVLVVLVQAVTEKPRAFLNHAKIAVQVKRGVLDQVAAE